MTRHEEVYDMIRDYEESDDATEDMLSLASEIDALTAERERLAAENAELREKLQTSERQRNEGACYFDELISKRDRANRNIASRNEQLWRCVGTAIRLKNKYHSQLAAANATLDRLREVVPEVLPPHMSWKDSLDAIRAILNPETTSIRDTAAAHGFDAMPDDIAQRSVDGETNYVRLNPENET